MIGLVAKERPQQVVCYSPEDKTSGLDLEKRRVRRRFTVDLPASLNEVAYRSQGLICFYYVDVCPFYA